MIMKTGTLIPGTSLVVGGRYIQTDSWCTNSGMEIEIADYIVERKRYSNAPNEEYDCITVTYYLFNDTDAFAFEIGSRFCRGLVVVNNQ